jgi:hypothetical protein
VKSYRYFTFVALMAPVVACGSASTASSSDQALSGGGPNAICDGKSSGEDPLCYCQANIWSSYAGPWTTQPTDPGRHQQLQGRLQGLAKCGGGDISAYHLGLEDVFSGLNANSNVTVYCSGGPNDGTWVGYFTIVPGATHESAMTISSNVVLTIALLNGDGSTDTGVYVRAPSTAGAWCSDVQ